MFWIIIILIIIIIFWFLSTRNIEGYGSPTGAALMQLRAVGPMDSYLIGNADKYLNNGYNYADNNYQLYDDNYDMYDREYLQPIGQYQMMR